MDVLKLNLLGQEAERLEQQIQILDQQVSELSAVKDSLETIKDKKNKDILANLGKGIFISTEVKNLNLLVNIGKNVLVKKTPEETIEIIDEQLKKLASGREKILRGIERLQEDMAVLLEEERKGKS